MTEASFFKYDVRTLSIFSIKERSAPGVFARLVVDGSVVSYVVTPAKAATRAPLIARYNGTAPLALKAIPQNVEMHLTGPNILGQSKFRQ